MQGMNNFISFSCFMAMRPNIERRGYFKNVHPMTRILNGTLGSVHASCGFDHEKRKDSAPGRPG